MINGCDGLVIATPHFYEPRESLDALVEWFGKTNREVHIIGPLLPTADDAGATERKQSEMAQEIDSFMTRIMASHGPRSMLYVSPRSHLHWLVADRSE